jgi:hypothetical protein
MKTKAFLTVSISSLMTGSLFAHEAGIPHVHAEGSYTAGAVIVALVAGAAYFVSKKISK